MFFYILWCIPSYYPNKQEDSNGGGLCLWHPRTSRWNFSRQSMFDRHLACWSNILSANGRCQHQQWGGKPYKNKPPWIFKCYIIKQKRWFLHLVSWCFTLDHQKTFDNLLLFHCSPSGSVNEFLPAIPPSGIMTNSSEAEFELPDHVEQDQKKLRPQNHTY